jgi:hypothetical protein
MHRTNLFYLAFLAVVSACAASRTPDESCTFICDKGALCDPNQDAALCAATCRDLVKEDAAYGEAMVDTADCIAEQEGYYGGEKGVCPAIQGGACVTPDK